MRRTSLHPHIATILLLVLPAIGFATRAGANWFADGVPMVTESHSQHSPSIVSDGANGANVIWGDKRFGDDVMGQRVNANGIVQWTPDGISVCGDLDQQLTPFALSGPSNGAIVFWQDNRGSSYDIYAQRITGTGLSQFAPNGIPIGADGDDERTPLAVSDGANGMIIPVGWIVVWVRQGLSSDDLCVQRVNADGALWVSAGSGGITLVSNIASLTTHAIASDGTAAMSSLIRGAVVAWSETRSSPLSSDIYARRIDSNHIPQWASSGVAVCDLAGQQQNPAIIQAGSGMTIIAWDDTRTANRNIWAQKLNSSGAAQWLADGLPVCEFSGTQFQPRLVPDNAGGAYVIWPDFRSGTNYKIYAQRLDANGQRLWTPQDGIPLCTGSGNQTNPAVVSDGANGFIVTWQDSRGTDDDLYAQRVDPSGNLLWAPSGVAITRASGNQQFPRIATDGASGALVAWPDLRAGNSDIYVNRVMSTGVVDVQLYRPAALQLTFAGANPSRGEVRMRLDLPEPAIVTAEVLDVSGRHVRSLETGSPFASGSHVLEWDGAGDAGARQEPGVFFVRVNVGAERLAARVVRLK